MPGWRRTKIRWSEGRVTLKIESDSKAWAKGPPSLQRAGVPPRPKGSRATPARPENRVSSLKIILRPQNLVEFFLLDWKHALYQWCLFLLLISTFGNWDAHPTPAPQLCLVSRHLVFCFTGSEIERNFALGWAVASVSPTPDLDNWEDDIWTFWDRLCIDEIWNLGFTLKWVKALGDIGIVWTHLCVRRTWITVG